MGMYDEIILDQENTIILLCQHMRRLITLLSAYTAIDKEEKFLMDVIKKQDIDIEESEEQ